MRIALGQLDMVWENADASIDRAETLIKQAAEAAAECIIFPEMSFTGVTLNTAKVAEDPKEPGGRRKACNQSLYTIGQRGNGSRRI